MKRHFIAGIVLGVISLIFVFWLVNTDIIKTLELRFVDYRFRWRPIHKVNPNIIITAIDDSSISTLGRWPWPRKLHAGLLKVLSQNPPKAIGFDILFTEPEEDPREGDNALEYYTKLLGNVVYAGYLSDVSKKPILPIEELKDGGSVGFINAPPDRDGIIRKIPLVFKYDNNYLPSFSLQVLLTYLNITFSDLTINTGRYIRIPNLGDVPIDSHGNMLINFAGDQHVFREVAFQQLLSLDIAEEFRNRLFLVGITATGIGDQGHIPLATNVPLITVHANVLNTILNKDFIIKISFWTNIFIIIFAVFSSSFLNMFFRSIRAVLLTLLMILAFISVNIWFFQKNILIDILSSSFGIIAPFLLITVYRYGWEERQRRWIKKVFTHYLSSDVVETVLKDPKKLQLGGELKSATVLYLDLHNFSTYCEGREPSLVVNFLNETFDWITEIILRNSGMLDKYVGDAIISIFGAPLEMPLKDQAEKAVLTALEIIDRWNKMPVSLKGNMDIGIGINTGSMLIGNMGSRYIFNYTAIGDEVNIAARIQGLTDNYKTNIIITDSVYNLVRGKFPTEPLGEVTVKGRRELVIIYSIGKYTLEQY